MKPSLPLTIAIGLSLVLFTASLSLGPSGFGIPGSEDAARLILEEIRLPRAVLGFLVGGALGLSGAVLQGYLRNPLAEPGILGVTGGAALGAVVAIHTGLAAAFAMALPVGGLVGAALATAIIFLLAGGQFGPLTVILAGVAVSAIASAMTALVLNLADNPFAVSEMLYWLLGSLSDRSLLHVALAAPLIAIGCAVLMSTGRALDALILGEDAAENLGANLRVLRFSAIVGSALSVGAATAVAGAIGFVGLIIPHLVRPFVGYQPARVLGPSFFGGAALVLAADLLLRLLSPAGDFRLGVVTSLIGAPFFLWLVLKTRRELGPS
ncbi:MAG: iron ABC transporter permease [Alphaproteobacteria bacterium]|nr:iron ABC transporter permease [Alphaproteobacteria bacterium]